MFDHRSKIGRRAAVFPLALSMLLAFSYLSLSGCVSPKVDSFQKYHASLVDVRTGSEEAVRFDATESRKEFIDEAVEEGSGEFATDHLRLRFGGGALEYTDPPSVPLFVEARNAEKALRSLNDAFVNHADLLCRLAGGEAISSEKFDALAADINAGATNFQNSIAPANKALGNEVRNIPMPTQSLISTGVSVLLRQYLVMKQTDALRKAIEQSADDVKSYVNSGKMLIELCAAGLKDRYVTRYDELHEQLSGSLSQAKRRRAVEDMVALHDDFVDQIEKLNSVYDAYGKIPAAFASLKEATGGKPRSQADVDALFAAARRVVKLYDTLKRSSDAKSE